MWIPLLSLFVALALSPLAFAKRISVRPTEESARLIRQFDTDHDLKITVHDHVDQPFRLKTGGGESLDVWGQYPISNLLQELKLAERAAQTSIDSAKVFENPVARLSRSIRSRYWDNLTRRVDADHLQAILEDEKIPRTDKRYLYVSRIDDRAFTYFSAAAKVRP